MEVRLLDATIDATISYKFALKTTDYFKDWQQTPTIAEVIQDFFWEIPSEVNPDQKEVFGIFVQNTMIGILDLLHDYPEKETSVLGLLALCPDYRNRGYGQKAYDFAESRIKDRGQTSFRLGVLVDNHVAQTMWHKQGFHKIKQTETPYGLMDVMIKKPVC